MVMAFQEGYMNRETRKPGAATKGPADRGKPKSESSNGPSLVDDEFHDFFDKGDIGDYEGGVACSQPPSKPVAAQPEDQPARLVTPEQKARRAFFARVVGGVVTGCVLLLVVAAQFKVHGSAASSAPMERALAAQPAPRPDISAAPLLAPPPVVRADPAAAPPPPPVSEPMPTEEIAAVAPPAVEAPLPAAPQAPAASVAAPSPVAKVSDATPAPVQAAVKAAEPEARRAVSNRGMKLATRPLSRSKATVLPQVKPPVASAPAAPKQSFAAFPVD